MRGQIFFPRLLQFSPFASDFIATGGNSKNEPKHCVCVHESSKVADAGRKFDYVCVHASAKEKKIAEE